MNETTKKIGSFKKSAYADYFYLGSRDDAVYLFP